MNGHADYQKLLTEMICRNCAGGIVPTLFLHCCCAPCSSYTVEYLSKYFKITAFYYNPNISPKEEYRRRVFELKRFLSEFTTKYPVKFIEGAYEPSKYYEAVRGLESCSEGGARCRKCFQLRLEKTAESAKMLGFDYFATTLTISPMKDAAVLNEVGETAGEKFGIKHLPSNFKKLGGYKRSIELSKKYGLYRQNFCGCIFSKAASEKHDGKDASIHDAKDCI